MRPPGSRLLALARAVVLAPALTRVIEPTIADLQHEWSASAGAPLVARFGIRSRAYFAALVVVGHHILAGTVRGSITPPPWPIVRHVLLSSLLFVVASAAIQAFLASPRDIEKHWLVRTTDPILAFGVLSPCIWAFVFDRRVLAERGIPEPGASDIAKLTAVLCIGLLAWTGWIAPLVTKQYVASLSPGSLLAMSPRGWLLPELVSGVLTSPAQLGLIIELHQRLLPVALAPSAGMLCWSSLLRSRRNPVGVAAGFQLLSFSILGATFVSFSLALSGAFGQVAADWIGAVAVAIGALGILWIVRLDECSAQLTKADA